MSSHPDMKANSTMSAPGTGHSIREEMEVPGVAQEQILMIMVAGVTVEMDAPFQVGNSLTTTITVSPFYAEWLKSTAWYSALY